MTPEIAEGLRQAARGNLGNEFWVKDEYGVEKLYRFIGIKMYVAPKTDISRNEIRLNIEDGEIRGIRLDSMFKKDLTDLALYATLAEVDSDDIPAKTIDRQLEAFLYKINSSYGGF